MSLHEKRWWKKFFGFKEADKVDVIKDIDAVLEFLEEVNKDIKSILPELQKLEELEKEREVINSDKLLKVNLATQEKVFEKLLEKYEFLQDDVDINGSRLRHIAGEFLKHAEKAGMQEMIRNKRKDMKWRV